MHIEAAAQRADRQRVRETGRWLVRHVTDRCAVTIGLALLASDRNAEDIPLIRTIALLSNTFGPLAAHALRRRRGGTDALLWLGDRVDGWGRVAVVTALCETSDKTAREWLLRNACNGDYLNGYFAGTVATTAHLHQAITQEDPDPALIDHTGRLLACMASCAGMGMTLKHYPPAGIVLEAHARHISRLPPTPERSSDIATLARYIRESAAEELNWPPEQQARVLNAYLHQRSDTQELLSQRESRR